MRKLRFLRLILIAFSLSCFASATYALPANNGITISGIAQDSTTHAPIQDVTVLTDVSGTSFKATTDNLGKYSLNITFTRKPALIRLVASKKNYLPSFKLVSNIQPGRSYDASFSLIDITPPSKPVVTDDGQYTNSITTLHAKWSSEDKESGIRQYYYSIGTSAGATDVVKWTSAGKNTEITSTNLKLAPTKTYYFNVRAVNGIGLASTIGSSDGITVDVTTPTGTININNNAQYTKSIDVTLTLSATDTGSGLSQMQFSNDNISWSTLEAYATSKSWSLTSGDGTKTVYARFIDGAGNISTPASDTIILDTVAPVIAITSPQDGCTSTTQTITLSGTIDDNQATVTVNGTAATVSNNTFSSEVTLVQGQNTITAGATDLAGNNSSSSITVTYQPLTNSPPVITNISPVSGGTFLAGASINIQISATDTDNDTLEYQFKIDGVEKQAWSTSSTCTWTTVLSDIGSHVVTCQVRDNHGGEVSQDISYYVENPTAQEVLQKVADNFALINDMKANMTLTATLDGQPFGDTTYCIYYFMKPNKEKTETYFGADRLTKTDDTIIINDSNLYLVNPNTKAVNTINLLSQVNITLEQFIEMGICYNLPYFLRHTISRNDTASDFNRGLIAVDAIPNSPNSLYNKLQVQIDYKKGLIIKSSLYLDNSLMQTIETTESQQMTNGAWVPKVMVKKPVLSSGQLITTMTYDNISINTGLTDLDFDPNEQ